MSETIVAGLLVLSGCIVLTAAIGLSRLQDFFVRMHAPALASTFGAWTATLAAIVHFSVVEGGVALHFWLLVIVLALTSPVTAMVLARAALFRRRQAGDALPPPLSAGPGAEANAPAAPGAPEPIDS